MVANKADQPVLLGHNLGSVVAGAFLLYGLKYKDVIAREFGITFL
jgi:hypothetical protein